MKVKRRWIFLMTAMTLIAIAGVFAGEPTFDCDWSVISAADVAWLITATIFVLMMTPGLSFFYGGMVGAKNVISTMLQSFIAMGLISVLWVVIGFSLCFGDDIGGIIGNPMTFPMFRRRCCIYHARRKHIRWCLHTVGTVRIVPDEVCHHHAIVDYGFVCRACKVLGLYVLYDVLLLCHLLPTGPHDVAS